jgi:hypothetical protein
MKNPVQLTKAINPVRNSISRPLLRRGLPRKQQLPRTQAMWIIRGFLLIPLALALLWYSCGAAVLPCSILGVNDTTLVVGARENLKTAL